MELRSARVLIRPWLRHDDDLAEAWPPYNDPLDVIWNLPRSSLPGDGWSFSFEGGSMRRSWAVEDRFGRLIGRISLREIDEHRRQARLGITFGAPFVGQGLGTNALRIFIDYYFEELAFSLLVLDVAAPNQRAVRCYQRLGFSQIGSDWRSAGAFFDDRVLREPRYAAVRHFFRPGLRGPQVEFFEMQLSKEMWLAQRLG